MATNELTISRLNRLCLQCRSIAHNGSRLCEVRDKNNQNFKLKTKTYRYARNFN